MKSEEILQKFIKEIRHRYDIRLYPDKVERVCEECAQESFLLAGHMNLGYEVIDLKSLGIDEPYHKASLLGFPEKEKIKRYIVDPTYGQFFEDKTFKDFMFKKYKNFSDILLKEGYIEFTIYNILKYINGFIFSKAFTKDINELETLKNLEILLKENNIIDKEKQLK